MMMPYSLRSNIRYLLQLSTNKEHYDVTSVSLLQKKLFYSAKINELVG